MNPALEKMGKYCELCRLIAAKMRAGLVLTEDDEHHLAFEKLFIDSKDREDRNGRKP